MFLIKRALNEGKGGERRGTNPFDDFIYRAFVVQRRVKRAVIDIGKCQLSLFERGKGVRGSVLLINAMDVKLISHSGMYVYARTLIKFTFIFFFFFLFGKIFKSI